MSSMDPGRTVLTGVVLSLLAVACGGGEAPAPEASPPEAPFVHDATSKGTYRVGWHAVGGEVPHNEHFSIDVDVTLANGAPVLGAAVDVRCEMPAHGHGMNVVPAVRELGDGRYRAEGMLLHMRGDWCLGIDVIVDDVAESAEFDLVLE